MRMDKNIAKCGLDCGSCRAYIATKNNDRVLADEIAKLWSNTVEGTYTADDIWCDGCHGDRLHGFCIKCPSRLCARERSLANCGTCMDYPCKKLERLWDSWVEADPVEARANLERLLVKTPPS
jgi:hypothetical protein